MLTISPHRVMVTYGRQSPVNCSHSLSMVKLSETLRDIIARMEESDERIQELIKDHVSDSRKFLTETEQILRDN